MELPPSSLSEGVRAGSALSCALREFQGTQLAEEWLAVRMVTPPCSMAVDVHKSLYLVCLETLSAAEAGCWGLALRIAPDCYAAHSTPPWMHYQMTSW